MPGEPLKGKTSGIGCVTRNFVQKEKAPQMGYLSSLQTIVFALNGVKSLGGLVMLHIGIWLHLDHRGPVAEILDVGAPQLVQRVAHMTYLCMAAGSCSALVGFLGSWGALGERRRLLLAARPQGPSQLWPLNPDLEGAQWTPRKPPQDLLLMVSLLMAVLFAAEVASAVLAFSTTADVFVAHLKTWALKCLKEDYQIEEDITAFWSATMKERFWYMYYYPAFCCTKGEKCYDSDIDYFKQGCLQRIQEFLKGKGQIAGGVCLGTGVLEVAAVAISLALRGQIGTSP
ncbi:UNVERIFIED_CONTAM: hypothetical protein K2H54_054187 [Gekko kuhli]